MNLVRSCSESNAQSLCKCAKLTLQNGTLSRSPVDSVLTTIGVDVVNVTTPASFRVAILTINLLYDRRGSVLLDDPIFIFVPQLRFVSLLFDLCRLFLYTSDCTPRRAGACSFVNNMA